MCIRDRCLFKDATNFVNRFCLRNFSLDFFAIAKFRCNINRILFLGIKNCFCFHSSSVCGNLYCWVLRDSHCTGLWTLQDHGTCKIYNIGQNRLPFLHSSAKPPYKIHRMHFTVKAMTMLETQRQTTSAIADVYKRQAISAVTGA